MQPSEMGPRRRVASTAAVPILITKRRPTSAIIRNGGKTVSRGKSESSESAGAGAATSIRKPSNRGKSLDLIPGSTPRTPSLSNPRKTRNYACESCGLTTSNPRLYLYHLREAHDEMFKIHECSLCVYATKEGQNLKRHLQMCHGGADPKSPANVITPVPAPVRATTVARKRIKKESVTDENPSGTDASQYVQAELTEDEDSKGAPQPLKLPARNIKPKPAKPQVKIKIGNSILKKGKGSELRITAETYHCDVCEYVTDKKARFTKHVRYHSMPVTKCTYCDFQSPYKWNLDRHILSHSRGGAKQCPLCTFSTDMKQSLTFHLHNHHSSIPSDKMDAVIAELSGELDVPHEELNFDPGSYEETVEFKPKRARLSLPMTSVQKSNRRAKPVPKLIPITVSPSVQDQEDEKARFMKSISLSSTPGLLNESSKPQALVIGTLRQEEVKMVANWKKVSGPSSGNVVVKKNTSSNCLRKNIAKRMASNKNMGMLKRRIVKKAVTRMQCSKPAESQVQSSAGSDSSDKIKPQVVRICSSCPSQFTHSRDLKIHEAFHSRESIFKCELCTYSVDIKDVLILHMRAHSPNFNPVHNTQPKQGVSKSWSDDEAYTVGNPGFNYSTYMRNGRPKSKRYKCQMCPFSTEKRDQYHTHTRLHGSNQTYTCPVCEYSVMHFANYKQHSKLHEETNVSEQSAENPPPNFPTVTSNWDESLGTVFRCNMCPYATIREIELRQHMQKHLSLNLNAKSCFQQLQICSICHFGTRNRAAYLQHQKIHFNLMNQTPKPEKYMLLNEVEIFVEDEEQGGKGGRGEKIYSEMEDYGLEEASGDDGLVYRVDMNTGETYDTK